MANTTLAKSHILQRAIPFPGEAFGTSELPLEAGQTVVLSSYFQLLHLSPLKHLELDAFDLFVEMRGQGSIRFEVIRHEGADHPLAAGTLDLDSSEAMVRFRLPVSQCEGLAYVKIVGESRASVTQLAWGISLSEAKVVPRRLAIVSCTFNRPKEILRTIGSIQSSESFKEGSVDIVVVDNGNNLELPQELSHPRLHLVGQRNLGGAGGFTRGILEASRFSGLDHILLMDDDVELVPEVIDRLGRWLAILPANVCVSGAMLDGLKRTMLYEAGARFISHTFEVKPEYSQIQLGDAAESLKQLARPSQADYGAWWFFAFPKKAIEAAGLPLPVFIRGDDIEYGLRLKRPGFKTVVIHGLAVWHEPFYLKRSIWPMYYAVRNFTLINAIHFRTPAKVYLASVARMFMQFALRFDYGAAAAIERGLSDFLKGPEFLLKPGDETHSAVTKYLAHYQCENLSAEQVTKSGAVNVSSMTGQADRIVQTLTLNRHVLRPNGATAPQLFYNDYVSWRWIARDSYLQVHGVTGAGQLFKRDPEKFWDLSVRMAKTLALAALKFNSVSDSYRNGMSTMTSESSWRSYLGIGKVQDT